MRSMNFVWVVLFLCMLITKWSVAQSQGGKIKLVITETVVGKCHTESGKDTSVAEEKRHENGDERILSPDGKREAYAAKHGQNKWVIVVDGVDGREYVIVKSPVFSPDSKRIAYSAVRDQKESRESHT